MGTGVASNCCGPFSIGSTNLLWMRRKSEFESAKKVQHLTPYKKGNFRDGVISRRNQKSFTPTDYKQVNPGLRINAISKSVWLTLDEEKLSYNSNYMLAGNINDNWKIEMCRSVPSGLFFIGLLLISLVCSVIWKKILELCYAKWMKLNSKSSLKYEESPFKCLEGLIMCYMNYVTNVNLLALVSPSIIPKYGISVGISLHFWLLLQLNHFIFKWVLENWMKTDNNMKTSDIKFIVSIQRCNSVMLIAIGCLKLLEVIGISVFSQVSAKDICGFLARIGWIVVQKEIVSNFYPEYFDKFPIGGNIKAGLLEGKIADIAQTTIKPLSNSIIPVVAPNSLLSDLDYESICSKIKCNICNLDDYKRLLKLLNDIKKMITSEENVFIGEDDVPPHVVISDTKPSVVEISIYCNIKKMREDLFREAKQSIVCQVIMILEGNNIKVFFEKQ